MDNIQVGDNVVWCEVNLASNRELYRKRLKDYGLGPFQVLEMDKDTVTVAKGGIVLVYTDTKEIVKFLKFWFKKAA